MENIFPKNAFTWAMESFSYNNLKFPLKKKRTGGIVQGKASDYPHAAQGLSLNNAKPNNSSN